MTVVQAFYGLLAAQTRTVNAERAHNEGQHFLDLSRKLEEGGEVAHSDTIKAQIQANDLKRAWEEAKLGEQNARLSLAVLLFPNFFQDFTLVNDLSTAPALPPMNELQDHGREEQSGIAGCLCRARSSQQASRRGACRISCHRLSVDMFYGIDANQFATRAPSGVENLGYAGTATLNIPVWNWGATQSKVRQAELLRHQAQVELSAAQRQAIADLQSFYSEAQLAYSQLADAAADCRSRRAKPAAHQPALPGRRSQRARSGGRAKHADGRGQQLITTARHDTTLRLPICRR